MPDEQPDTPAARRLAESAQRQAQVNALNDICQQLKRLADRLDSWEVEYRTQAGKVTHSMRVTANVYDAGRR